MVLLKFIMERETNQTQQPSLCRTGCGFYGNSAFDGLCSKCFKDALRRKQQSPSPTQVAASSQGTSSEDGNSSTAVPAPVVEAAAAACEPSTSVTSNTESEESRNLEAATSTEETKDKPKPKKNRCFMCRKKVGLTGFECRCGNLYCGLHRYSDKHDCTFDYKAEGRAAISKANPVVVGSKIQKI